MTEHSIAEVGSHFLVGLRPTPVLDERDRVLLRDLRPAGVILYKSNFRHDLSYGEWLASHARLIEDIHSACGREHLWIGIDHEGGRVCRTPAPITRFTYAAHWGDRAAAIGEAMGVELASLGINLNFAPVLDIHTNPANPVIGERAFGSDAETVIEHGLGFLRAMEAQHVLGCGKHFPGHGDTSVDSHYGLPSQAAGLDDLRRRELLPFIAAIKAGVSMLMTSHILFPAVDPEFPVTLSRRFCTELLREELGYRGVVVSDDIGMGAMNAFFAKPEAAARLLASGCDLIMVCAHWTETERVRDFAQAILRAREDGLLSEPLLSASQARIDALLRQAPRNAVTRLTPEIFERHTQAGPLFEAKTVEVI